MRLRTGYLDKATSTLDEALALIDQARQQRKALSIGLLGNAAEILPQLYARGVRPDLLTDQTSAHDPLNGYLPIGLDTGTLAAPARGGSCRRSAGRQGLDGCPCRSDARFPKGRSTHRGLRQQHPADGAGKGVTDAFAIPGFVPQYIRPLFCRGVGPFRWVALSGDPADI